MAELDPCTSVRGTSPSGHDVSILLERPSQPLARADPADASQVPRFVDVLNLAFLQGSWMRALFYIAQFFPVGVQKITQSTSDIWHLTSGIQSSSNNQTSLLVEFEKNTGVMR